MDIHDIDKIDGVLGGLLIISEVLGLSHIAKAKSIVGLLGQALRLFKKKK